MDERILYGIGTEIRCGFLGISRCVHSTLRYPLLGTDWLICSSSYIGDPLRFHSHFVCTVLPSPLANIAPLDIVAWGRLATAVKKAHLIASWDEKKGEVEYLSLEWSGFG